MATNETTIAATPEQVFDILLDAGTYERWVMGCDDIRAVDPDWPQPGSKFHHTVGFGPLKVQDTTKVIELDAPHRLVLEARARPAGVAKVSFTVTPCDEGSKVEIEEYPTRGVAKTIDNPVLDGMIKARNVETLRRLEREVEKRIAARS